MNFLSLVCLVSLVALASCGHSGSSSIQPVPLNLSGNWQFTMAPPVDGSFVGGLQGGFLLQNSGSSATGSIAYSIALPSNVVCNSGSAAVTGTISGTGVNLTATAGTQTFTLVGALALDGNTMSGTYTSTAGTAADGSPCGSAETNLNWFATLVPTLLGSVQGTFYSGGGSAGLYEQDFLVSGALSQGANTGASSTSVVGNLSFYLADYPCLIAANVSGSISGNTLSLQLLANDGTVVGQIGSQAGANTGINPVTVNTVAGGYIISGPGPSYIVATGLPPAAAGNRCPGSLSATSLAGDFGSICLAGNSASGCTQPITLSPLSLSFPAQTVGTTSKQTVALTNTSKSNLGNLTLSLSDNAGVFTESDECGVAGASSSGQPFQLIPGQACLIAITYAPQCNGTCPSSQKATLVLTIPGDNMIFTLPISGTPKLDSASVELSRASIYQSLISTDGVESAPKAHRSSRGQDPDFYAEDH